MARPRRSTRTGTADLPLHGGRCPPWLFARMKALAAAVAEVVVQEFGTGEFLARLSEPVWFQAFGAVLGFDWHSSGLTTVVCGALKEGAQARSGELGLFFAGGKGAQSRATPAEIVAAADRHGLPPEASELPRASRLAAKVDSAALQDGFQLYHHFFAFDRAARWAVVQQGMSDALSTARRYHWLGEAVDDFTEEPHSGLDGPPAPGAVLDMTARESGGARAVAVDIARQPPEEVARDLRRLASLTADGARVGATASPPRHPRAARAISLFDASEPAEGASDPPPAPDLVLARSHRVPHTSHIDALLWRLYERRPEDYAEVLLTPGCGPAAVRALSMVAEVAYGAPPSRTDPVRYAFAHGGKDGHPFPVRRRLYDHSIQILHAALERARVGEREQLAALRRLGGWRQEAGVRL